MSTTPDLSYQTVRARIAHALIAHYSRAEILERLACVGHAPSPVIEPIFSTHSLAYQVAWALLPAAPLTIAPARWEVVPCGI